MNPEAQNHPHANKNDANYSDLHEGRFVDIEIKLAHQEDLVESLNARIYEQQKQIDGLEAMFAKLAEYVRTRDSAQAPLNERPPHY